MKREIIVLVALGLLAARTAFADNAIVKICRYPGIDGLMDSKTIPIDAGASFAEGLDKNGNGGDRFEVSLIDAVKLPPKPACVIASVRITKNTMGSKLTAKSGMMVAQFNIPGAEIIAYVVDSAAP